MTGMKFLISGIRSAVDSEDDVILKKARDKMKRAGISISTLHFRLYKKSIDARHREEICFESTVLAESAADMKVPTDEQLSRANAKRLPEAPLEVSSGSACLEARPLVVGMGPAGLFAALLLARYGYRPILIDRGASVDERERDVAAFRQDGRLHPNSNIQFGAGGAGTFSDGKLITRIHDARCGFVLQTLCQFGAPQEILVKAKPHIGTDILRTVVSNLLSEIERLGGTVRYHCCMETIGELPDGTLCVRTSSGDIHCGALILAIGHSARDTYQYLLESDFALEPKPISVGVRAEHLQSDIDAALYGRYAGHPKLGPAEYALSDTRGAHGVYTFCMCPGGEVVAASSEEGYLAVNGMSYHARNGKNANAAVAVSVGCESFESVHGSRVLGAIAFQRRLERAAYLAGGGDYYAPIMTMGDFLNGTRGSVPSRILPSYRDGKVRVSDFETIFPPFVVDALRYGMRSFGQRLKGYDAPDAVLTAAETRTSAPLRILRDPQGMTALGHDRIYPCGEGAGYAGGITSAAVDGLRSAQALMARFSLPKDEM